LAVSPELLILILRQILKVFNSYSNKICIGNEWLNSFDQKEQSGNNIENSGCLQYSSNYTTIKNFKILMLFIEIGKKKYQKESKNT
jgi:hypothetical protein